MAQFLMRHMYRSISLSVLQADLRQVDIKDLVRDLIRCQLLDVNERKLLTYVTC